MDGILLLGSLRTQWNVEKPYHELMSCRSIYKLLALLSELLKQSLKSEKESFWNTWADFAQVRTKPNTLININTYHLACAKGSALQCIFMMTKWKFYVVTQTVECKKINEVSGWTKISLLIRSKWLPSWYCGRESESPVSSTSSDAQWTQIGFKTTWIIQLLYAVSTTVVLHKYVCQTSR